MRTSDQMLNSFMHHILQTKLRLLLAQTQQPALHCDVTKRDKTWRDTSITLLAPGSWLFFISWPLFLSLFFLHLTCIALSNQNLRKRPAFIHVLEPVRTEANQRCIAHLAKRDLIHSADILASSCVYGYTRAHGRDLRTTGDQRDRSLVV